MNFNHCIGIFHNNAENLFVWVNEEDQLRIVSMEKGDNVKRIIERFAAATSTIQKCLQAEGYDFMHSEHLGWILTCPSNLGTGLRAGAMVKVYSDDNFYYCKLINRLSI